MKRFDVVAIGELLIDFCEKECGVFEANPGGAPCNVLAMLRNLGKNVAFIGKVGKDMFGEMLKETIEGLGIYAEGLLFDEYTNTALAFVHNKEDGEREFSFYRSPGADEMLRMEEVNDSLIRESRIFHFGTLSSTNEISREATRYALDVAKESGCLISFDPNLRERLWDSLERAKEEILYGIGRCDILKISDNELEFLMGNDTSYDEGMKILLDSNPNIKIGFLTLGKEGAVAYTRKMTVKSEGFTVKTVDTTGAGDTFTGCILNCILENGIENLEEKQLYDMLIFANYAAALVTEKKGALCVMPKKEEINKFLGWN